MKWMLVLALGLGVLISPASSAAREITATIVDPDGHSNLRDKAGKVIGKVKAGERITAIQPDDNSPWWLISLPSGEKGYVHESRLRISDPDREGTAQGRTTRAALPKAADVSIIGIELCHPESSERVLGRKIEFVEEDGGFPAAKFVNAKGTEQLELTAHYGGLVNEVREIEVRAVSGKTKGRALSKTAHFTSGKGIRLGMTENDVAAILGKPGKVSRSGKNRVWEYRISDPAARYHSSDGLIETFELYYGRYTFREGTLHEFGFGFEYP